MLKKCLIVVVLILNVIGAKGTCNTFYNTRINLTNTKRKSIISSAINFSKFRINFADSYYYKNVTGCINRTLFDENEVIVKLYVYKESIPIIDEETVTDFDELESITFLNCGVNSIKLGAFKRLPKLNTLTIVFNNLNELNDDLFKGLNIATLKVNNNRIDIIRSNTFRNMSYLKYFYGYDNLISQYNIDWFKDSPDLRRITLSKNKLRIVPRRAFFYNTKLEMIELSDNDIDLIERDAFEGIQSLNVLNLRHNRIKLLNSDSFPSNISIIEFIIDRNKLHYLAESLLKILSVKKVLMRNNPWDCKCLNAIFKWYSVNKVKIADLWMQYCANLPICVNLREYNNATNCMESYDEESVEYFFKQIVDMNLSRECFRMN